MKRRSKVSGERANSQRGKAAKANRRNAPKAVAQSNFSSGNETEVARLTRELNEAWVRETAASDVLEVISRSSGELEPVFKAILASATSIATQNSARCG